MGRDLGLANGNIVIAGLAVEVDSTWDTLLSLVY